MELSALSRSLSPLSVLSIIIDIQYQHNAYEHTARLCHRHKNDSIVNTVGSVQSRWLICIIASSTEFTPHSFYKKMSVKAAAHVGSAYASLTLPSPGLLFDPKNEPRLDCFISARAALFKSRCSSSLTQDCLMVS